MAAIAVFGLGEKNTKTEELSNKRWLCSTRFDKHEKVMSNFLSFFKFATSVSDIFKFPNQEAFWEKWKSLSSQMDKTKLSLIFNHQELHQHQHEDNTYQAGEVVHYDQQHQILHQHQLRDQQPDQHQHVHNTLEAGEGVQHALHQLQEIDASQVLAAEEKNYQ